MQRLLVVRAGVKQGLRRMTGVAAKEAIRGVADSGAQVVKIDAVAQQPNVLVQTGTAPISTRPGRVGDKTKAFDQDRAVALLYFNGDISGIPWR